MKRRTFLAALATGSVMLPVSGLRAQNSSQQAISETKRAAAQEWFQDNKFGMFIHWGVYSVLGKGEWVMQNDQMPISEYEKLPPQFNPTEFDADEWVSIAKDAGMRYITITSKHHDGFAMWDSQVRDYNIVDATPYGQDVLKMLSEACQRQGLKLFFYYSHLDWHHPDYYPRGRTGQFAGRPDEGNFERYRQYMKTQIGELASGNYGELGGFWFDGWWDQQTETENDPVKKCQINWRLGQTYDLIHELQSQALVGNNHHVKPFPGEDFQMFERDLPGQNTAGYSEHATLGSLPLESCDTMNNSWGYNATDNEYKSSRELIHYLVRSAGSNGNFLLNVGPTPAGIIPEQSVSRLREVGDWIDQFGNSIYGTRGGPMPPQEWGVTTQKGWKVYLHILDPTSDKFLTLPDTADMLVESAMIFNTRRFLPVTRDDDLNVVVDVEHFLRHPVDTVVVLQLMS